MKNSLHKQKGFATLFVSLTLLVLISLNVFIGAKGSVVEQRSANNQYRSEEAFQNAEAGLAQLISDIKTYIAANPTSTDFSSVLAAVSTGKYSATFNQTTQIITSIGYGSGDATRTITQRITLTKGTSGPAALNALGSINLAGSASATDVKAGQGVTFSGSGSVAGSNTTTNNVNVTQNASEFKVADIAAPGGYRSMNPDEYFMYFFSGLCPNAKAAHDAKACKAEAYVTVKADTKGFVCDSGCGSLNDTTLSTQYDTGKRIFWLEGGMNHKLQLGTVADPVLILVMNVQDGGGSVHINGNSEINGILYIDILTKECNCSASATVTGTKTNTVTDYTNVVSWTTSLSNQICTKQGNQSCSQTLTDGHGNTKTVTTAQGQKLVDPASSVVTYGTKDVTVSILNTPSYQLTGTNVAACTVAACEQAEVKCPLSTAPASIGTMVSCAFKANAVNDPSNSVEIDIVGTWDNSGGGKTLINGAAITSGNFTGQGNIAFVRQSSVITSNLLSGAAGAGFTNAPTSFSIVPNGWTDVVQ